MTITLFVVAGLTIGSAALSSTLKQLTEKVDVNVYFAAKATEAEIMEMKQMLEALPEVSSAAYTSREDALLQFRERHKNDQLTLQALEELSDNPLGATLSVRAKQTSQYESIARFLDDQQKQGAGAGAAIDKVNFYQNKIAIDRLTNIIDTSKRMGVIFALILGLASILIAFNTIRLAIYTSRDEIGVMNIVGAGRWYVRGPFMVAGVLYGIVSGLAVLLLLYPLMLWIGPASERFLGSFNAFSYFIDAFPLIFSIVMATGITLGALSSYLAVRRYLRS